ncbi:MAG: tRNA-intron lyase [Candidatus Hydrothermarchaeales archaeon]
MGTELIDDRIIIKDEALASKLEQRGFGKLVEDRLELSLLEGLFLLERGTISIREGERDITPEDILQKVDKEEFMLRYGAYKDLRERGYIVKTGFKFGVHFRVYERGDYLDKHSTYLVHAVPESYTLSFPELSRAVRLSQSVKKKMIFAVVDEEGGITYYTIDRISP